MLPPALFIAGLMLFSSAAALLMLMPLMFAADAAMPPRLICFAMLMLITPLLMPLICCHFAALPKIDAMPRR